MCLSSGQWISAFFFFYFPPVHSWKHCPIASSFSSENIISYPPKHIHTKVITDAHENWIVNFSNVCYFITAINHPSSAQNRELPIAKSSIGFDRVNIGISTEYICSLSYSYISLYISKCIFTKSWISKRLREYVYIYIYDWRGGDGAVAGATSKRERNRGNRSLLSIRDLISILVWWY